MLWISLDLDGWEPEERACVAAALESETWLDVVAFVTGRRTGRAEAALFARELLRRFEGVATDDYSPHPWTLAEIEHDEQVGGLRFFEVYVPEQLALLDWLPPWEPVGAGLEAELAREAGPRHPLAGRRAISVGRRHDNDDVLFFLPDGPTPLAVVHLTWSGRRERDLEWPATTLYDSVEAWVNQGMEPDHREFLGAAD